MSGFKGKKKVFSDIIWSIMALMAMHGVLQIVVYPSLNKRWGADAFGESSIFWRSSAYWHRPSDWRPTIQD